MQRLILCLVIIFTTCAFGTAPDVCVHREDCPTPESGILELTQLNPTIGWFVTDTGTPEDPLTAFGRRPIDEPWRIPEKGKFRDPDRETPHFGIDFTDQDAIRGKVDKLVYPVGPGIVTAIHPCLPCWADSEFERGQIRSAQARHNFGYGALVVIEHPISEEVSFYTLYSHLREIQVSVGQYVDSDIPLAWMGKSGDAAATHVHFELRYGLPNQFWGADFAAQATIDRWIRVMYNTPAFLFYPDNHDGFLRELDRWVREIYPYISNHQQ